MIEAIGVLMGLSFVGAIWLWVCLLFAVCMVAEEKNRGGFLAFVAYVFTGPAALYYYWAVPAKAPKSVTFDPVSPKAHPIDSEPRSVVSPRNDIVDRFIKSGS